MFGYIEKKGCDVNFDYSQAGDQYRKQSIETASPVRLVVMLYEGAVKFIDCAIEKMDYSSYDQVHLNVQKAKDIVVELRTSLDFKQGGEIATRLDALYDFVYTKLGQGNLEKKIEPLQEAHQIFKELLASWQEISQIVGREKDEKMDSGSSGFSVEG